MLTEKLNRNLIYIHLHKVHSEESIGSDAQKQTDNMHLIHTIRYFATFIVVC